MLKKEDAIEVVKRDSTLIYIFRCSYLGCENIIRLRSSYIKKATGFCTKHAHQKRPFEHIFKSIGKDNRKVSSVLTYEEFLEFTKIKQCYYCLGYIPWEEFAYVDGKYTSKAYFLDRKINSASYSKENCVVCCTNCNKMKSNLDHNDFIAKCNLIGQNFIEKQLRALGLVNLDYR